MRNIFCLDGCVGLNILEWLCSKYIEDIGLVCAVSDKTDVYKFAKSRRISVVLAQDLIAVPQSISSSFDYGFLVWWPYIVKKDFLDMACNGFVNTHPSYLPYNRGKNYNFWAIVEEVTFGVSLHKVTEEIDSGDILARKKIAYGWEDTGETLFYKAQKGMIKLFKSSYPSIRDGKLIPIPQSVDEGSFHYSNEMPKACKIDLDRLYTARELFNLLRARTFTSHPSCTFVDDGHTYEVRISIKEKNDE